MEYYEFFAGGGMARLGLGSAWKCVFANDIDERKAACYLYNFKNSSELKVCDIAKVQVSDLPGHADLAWASFPCQDLSLAGNGAGLKGERSGLFWEFWRLMRGLRAESRAPRAIILENVYGTITSHKGRDLAAICDALANDITSSLSAVGWVRSLRQKSGLERARLQSCHKLLEMRTALATEGYS